MIVLQGLSSTSKIRRWNVYKVTTTFLTVMWAGLLWENISIALKGKLGLNQLYQNEQKPFEPASPNLAILWLPTISKTS